MPLLDHFRPPLSERRHWEAFHAAWSTTIASSLNDFLPDDYFAEPQVHAGPRIEVDIATWDSGEGGEDHAEDVGGVATLAKPKAKPKVLAPADLILPMTFPPSYGIHILETSGGPTLVAAIELVSPGNKDRPDARRAFAAKCHSYVQAGCGLIVVDIVTSRSSRPFDDLIAEMSPDAVAPPAGPLTAASYRPLREGDIETLEVRVRTLSLGGPLPTLPLSLNAGLWVEVDFDATYVETCAKSRL